jgi:hypothetical protein
VLEVDTELQPTRLPLGPIRHGTAVGSLIVAGLASDFVPEPDPTDNLLGELRRWAVDQEVARLGRSRSRARWLRQQAAESATLAGVLLDLAERRATVTIDAAGWTHTGRALAVSTGLCLLDDLADGQDRLALVALPAVIMVCPPVEALGDRVPDLRLDMAGALAGLAGDRPTICLEVQGGRKVTGVLENVGVDLVTLRADREGGVVQLAVNAICVCLL